MCGTGSPLHRGHGWLGALPLVLLAAGTAAGQSVLPGAGGVASSAEYTAEVTVGETCGDASGAGHAAAAGFRAVLSQNAPSGSLPSLVATGGSAIVVSALLDDDIRVLSAVLRHRRGGGDAFQTVSMALADSATGRWEATIPGADVTVRGIQYYVEASDGTNVSTIPFSAPVGALANLSVRVAAHPAFALPAGQYILAATPLDVSNPDPAAVFASLMPYDVTRWRCGTWDPGAETYREVGAGAAPLEPGQGFWIHSREDRSVAAAGSSIDLSSDFELTLRPGFNQIGNPFAFPVDFADIVRPAGVEANLFGWNGSAHVPGVTVLQPGSGYWLRNNNSTAVVIRIPPRGAGVSRVPPAGPEGSAAAEPVWSVVARATAGGFSDDGNRFGVRAGATAAKDDVDFADAPLPPEGYVDVSFAGPGGLPLLTDWRGAPSEGESWRLVLRTDRVGQSYRVELAPERPVPEGWVVTATDPDGRGAVDLTGGGELPGTVTTASMRREWLIAAGPPAFVEHVQQDARDAFDASITEFALLPPAPNPLRRGADVRLRIHLPQSTGVVAEVFDIAGRRVARPLDSLLEQGAHEIVWNGRGSRGDLVAAGVYFLRVRAGAFVSHGKLVVLR